MVLSEIALLASDTARTKAYLQMMIRESLIPSVCLIYTDDVARLKRQADEFNDNTQQEGCKYFSLDEPILFTIQKYGLNYEIINDKDINSEKFSQILRGRKEKYFIYSGYGGYILKPHLFKLGKKFIHVHAGMLPEYRGSTTAYYSMLQERYIGATAIFLNEGIDEGEIIMQEKYPLPPKGTNIDTLYEPFVRSQVLKKTLEIYKENGMLIGKDQGGFDAQTYYIIHPVLKHLALMADV